MPRARAAAATPTEEAMVEAAIAAIRESPGTIPLDTLRSLSGNEGMASEDLISDGFEVDDDDLVSVYSTFDGTPSRINTSMLAKTLRKRFTQSHGVPPKMLGKLAFSLDQKVKPKRGTLKCMLHPDNPLREDYLEVGVPTNVICMKSNIPDEYNKMLHERNRHKTVLEIVSRAETKREADEKKAYDRTVLETMLALLADRNKEQPPSLVPASNS